ncbi:glutamate--cysteine ligase [Fulvivirga sp. RKSG066]|uniref:carboxylate-amine ligase n=1 Tax=Fulvivirga aurantia TaxID=2529383 RepID=UPI0012BD324F|nr:glutamate-cysteine ligase family protein [Fulvivirga aurantia]MTI20638.1 glutamate--cysteine ligase [Fulvivirga aurantia]
MKPSRIHLFQAYGIELEYMIAHKDTLAIKPITDELFKKVTGEYCSDVEKGPVTWCNELVLHVVELKCTEPTPDLVQLNKDFTQNIEEVNKQLAGFEAKLLPTAAHPLMNPAKDTYLWPHDNNAVYERYNQMFNCQGHGWSNLQSCHINLPFYDDEEFASLHAAIRLILPILPALAASSPILGGANTGFLDKRMDYYHKNQMIIPSITGRVIPERAFSKRQYHKLIYDRIAEDIAQYNEDDLLKPVWVNSRGAIARFDRGSVEIRVLDLQECPKADLAIATLIICVLKLIVSEKHISLHDQQAWSTDELAEILHLTIKKAEKAEITNAKYLKILGLEKSKASAQEVWKHLYEEVKSEYPEEIAPWEAEIEFILREGTLATRIIKSLGGIYTPENITMVYHELADCLANNEMFEVWVKEQL